MASIEEERGRVGDGVYGKTIRHETVVKEKLNRSGHHWNPVILLEFEGG